MYILSTHGAYQELSYDLWMLQMKDHKQRADKKGGIGNPLLCFRFCSLCFRFCSLFFSFLSFFLSFFGVLALSLLGPYRAIVSSGGALPGRGPAEPGVYRERERYKDPLSGVPLGGVFWGSPKCMFYYPIYIRARVKKKTRGLL